MTVGKHQARSGDVVDSNNDEWHWHGATQPLHDHLSLTEGDTESGDHVTARSTGAIE
jgi:hypothetical protein